jgi:hypothetical protein
VARIQSDRTPATRQQREAVLSKATVRAADHLNIPNMVLARILGISEASASRLRSGTFVLSDGTKPFELAQLFLRLFRSLDASVGSDDETARSWLNNENTALNGRPIELVQTISGLMATVNYVDARRAIL